MTVLRISVKKTELSVQNVCFNRRTVIRSFLIPSISIKIIIPMDLRENLGRLSFIAFLMLLYVSLFFLPQLSALI